MKYMSSSLSLRSPKKEEQQVPDTKLCEIPDDDDDEYEFESILNGNELENLCKVENEFYGSMNWDFMEWDVIETTADYRFKEEEEYKEIEEDEEGRRSFRFINDNDDINMVIKRETSSSSSLNLNLNLNYEQVLDAWSDKSPLLSNDFSSSSSSSMASSIGYYMGEVPEMEDERRRREASVLRYKEKRHTRLFSKKIRYQVRKLNADKRPRLKGRFVKRDS